MLKPKGSKTKKVFEQMESIEVIDECIAAAETAIASLTKELKAKKAELKLHQKMRNGSLPRRRLRKVRLPFWLLLKPAERAWNKS